MTNDNKMIFLMVEKEKAYRLTSLTSMSTGDISSEGAFNMFCGFPAKYIFSKAPTTLLGKSVLI